MDSKQIETDGYSPIYYEVEIPGEFTQIIIHSDLKAKQKLFDGRFLTEALTNVARELFSSEDIELSLAPINEHKDQPKVHKVSDNWEPLKIERSLVSV